MFHCFLLRIGHELTVDLCVFMNGILAEDVAPVVMDVYGQTVPLGFATQSTRKAMVLIKRIAARVLLAEKTP